MKKNAALKSESVKKYTTKHIVEGFRYSVPLSLILRKIYTVISTRENIASVSYRHEVDRGEWKDIYKDVPISEIITYLNSGHYQIVKPG